MQPWQRTADSRKPWGYRVLDTPGQACVAIGELAVTLAGFRAMRRISLNASTLLPQHVSLWNFMEILCPEVFPPPASMFACS